jgi:hypothetical protein
VTYENWCIHSKRIIAEAEVFNTWRNETLDRVLTNAGPRIAALAKVGYCGCGFHYSIVQTFGRLADKLSMPWQPTASWCEKYENDVCGTIHVQVVAAALFEQLDDAEACVAENKGQIGHCKCFERERAKKAKK